jgi:hypothetical protein
MTTPNWTQKILGKQDQGLRLGILEGEKRLSYQEVFQGWASDEAFALFYASILKQSGFSGFFWEHPALISEYLDQPYEFILLETDGFQDRKLNQQAFAEHLHPDTPVASFFNLGKNAQLVAPSLQATPDTYKHFGNFIRHAPSDQIVALFQQVEKLMLEEVRLGKRIWLNTEGMGVIWLHIRLDTRPKYYKSQRYKQPELLEQSR